MPEEGERKPLSKRGHKREHDLKNLSCCEEVSPKPSTFIERLVLFSICGSFFGVLWWLGPRLPFPAEVLQTMVGCYLLAATFCVFMPVVARMGSPIICILVYLSIFAPFVFIGFYNPHIPQIVGYVISAFCSIPIIFFAIGMIQRTIKILKGVDVLAEDERLEAREWRNAEQRLSRQKRIEQRLHGDEDHGDVPH